MKYVIEVSLNCTYEFDSEKYTEENAIEKAYDYFVECQPNISVTKEEN